MRKGENADDHFNLQHFLLSPQCFLPYQKKKKKGSYENINPFLHTHFNTLKKNCCKKTLWKKGEIAQNERFHLFPQWFLCSLILKSFNSNNSVVICSVFEFWTVSKRCIGEWFNPFPRNDTFGHH